MSLKVWLPLIKDFSNNGCSQIDMTLTQGNSWISTDGKIGNGALKITSDRQLISSTVFNGAKQFSWTMWVKVNTAWSANWKDGIYWITSDGSTTASNRQEFYTNCTQCGMWYAGSSISGKSFIPGVWTHLAGTVDYINGRAAFYIDGVSQGEKKNANTSHYVTSVYLGDSNIDISINDVRLYDHYLSPLEIKEISQGLVVHYKLDSFQGGYGNPNLLSANETNFFDTTRSFEFQGWVKNFYTTDWVNEHLTVGQQYTLSYTVTCISIPDTSIYSVSETRSSPILVHQGSGWSQVTTTNDGIKSTDLLPGQSRTYKCTFIFNTAAETQNYYGFCGYTCLYRDANNTSIAHAKFRIDNLKLELGSDATPWIPNVNDEIINVTHVQDSSGYGNNGTILNAAKISSDAPRYLYSMSLPDANSMINCGRGGMVTDSITVNFWLKSSSWANPTSCTEGGGWNFEKTGNYFRFTLYIADVGYKHSTSTTTYTTVCNNQWHMLTGVYDRVNQKIKIYVDGELENDVSTDSSNSIKYHASNVIWIGAEATGSNTTASNGMVGLFSDYRIYCTPLLDTDIKQLYNTSMKMDNLNNIHIFNIEETNNNILASVPLTKAYGNRSELFTNYNSNGEPEFTANNTSAGTDFIPIIPGVYEYDYTITTNAGNMFYIGFERFDKDKTARSNNACVYIKASKNESIRQHVQSTVDLSTDGVNSCAYIALRVLNGWSGTTSGVTGQATIHNISLRLKSDTNKVQLTKQGNLIIEEIKEDTKASFHKLGIVEASTFIEK